MENTTWTCKNEILIKTGDAVSLSGSADLNNKNIKITFDTLALCDRYVEVLSETYHSVWDGMIFGRTGLNKISFFRKQLPSLEKWENIYNSHILSLERFRWQEEDIHAVKYIISFRILPIQITLYPTAENFTGPTFSEDIQHFERDLIQEITSIDKTFFLEIIDDANFNKTKEEKVKINTYLIENYNKTKIEAQWSHIRQSFQERVDREKEIAKNIFVKQNNLYTALFHGDVLLDFFDNYRLINEEWVWKTLFYGSHTEDTSWYMWVFDKAYQSEPILDDSAEKLTMIPEAAIIRRWRYEYGGLAWIINEKNGEVITIKDDMVGLDYVKRIPQWLIIVIVKWDLNPESHSSNQKILQFYPDNINKDMKEVDLENVFRSKHTILEKNNFNYTIVPITEHINIMSGDTILMTIDLSED